MARTKLPNGVILPAEYSDDWYGDMTSNLTKLDDVIGSDSEKLNSNDVAFLRMSSAALTDGGTGNFSDLNSSNKLKTGDYVLDSGRKLYQIVSVDSTNETFTVGNSLFKVTAESDLAPVAESGDYDDLDNKPDLKPVATSGDYDDLTNKPDLNPYDQHLANTEIHVTTADKNRWNNNTYVLRYSSTTLVASSTNSNSLLDNTYNLKVGDKVIDASGVIYSVTAIDTANSTFTIGTALIDLAQDSDVVHKSGNETISGTKTFLDVPIPFKSSTAELGVTGGNTKVIFTDKNLLNLAGITFGNYGSSKLSYCRFHIYDKDSNNQEIENYIEFSYVNNNNFAYFRPNKLNFVTLGSINNRWSKVYADEYYYGSNSVEFSQKFVTTDTAQTISGNKTFSDTLTIYNSDDTVTPKGLIIRNAQWSMGESGATTVSSIDFLDKNYLRPASVTASKGLYGQSYLRFSIRTKDSQNTTYAEEIYYDIDTSGNVEFRSWHDNIISLGTSVYKWKDVQTYKINGLEPSALGMPSGNANDVIDISSYITDLSGTVNLYTPPANGYLTFTFSSGAQVQIYPTTGGGLASKWTAGSGSGIIRGFIPVLKNVEMKISVNATTMDSFYFIPCQGNV